MGAGGVPNRTCEIIDGRPGDLPICGAKPNSRYDLYVKGKNIRVDGMTLKEGLFVIEIISIKIITIRIISHMTMCGVGFKIGR